MKKKGESEGGREEARATCVSRRKGKPEDTSSTLPQNGL